MGSQAEFVIVGAGITGLYTAYHLIEKQGIKGKQIGVFSDGNHLSSRLNSYCNSQGHVCELGAARFNSHHHPLLAELIQRFGLDVISFKYKTYAKHLINSFNKEDLARLFSYPHPSSESFFSFASSIFGKTKASLLCSLSGYYALRSPRMSVSMALQIIQNHPESFFTKEVSHQWYSLSKGFNQLIECLIDYLKEAGVHFFYSLKIKEMSQKEGWLNLTFLKDECEYLSIKAEKCFLALPFSKIKEISMPWRTLDYLYRHIVDVPLFKCFLGYENACWSEEVEGACFLTQNECQKIYVNGDKKTIFFYCDSKNSIFWHHLMQSDRENFLNEIYNRVSEEIGCSVTELKRHKACVARFWPIGVSYWDRNLEIRPDGYTQLNENIYLCSDIFTEKTGWIEGGLMSSQYACSSILTNSYC